MMKTFASLFLLLVICAFIGGCSNNDLDANGVPKKLVIGMDAGDKPGQTKAAIEPFRLYLQKKMGMEVQIIFTTDYTGVIEALRAKKIEAAQMAPFAYILATQKPGISLIATFG